MLSLYSQIGKRKDIRMANLSIPSIRERLFNTSKHEQTTQRNSSNPFAATSFKGNVLTADVFESSSNKNENKISATDKLKASALVGSISGYGERFQNMINSVISFGNRVKENVVNGWNKMNSIEISFAPAREVMGNFYGSIKDTLNTPMNEIFFTGISAKSVSKMEDMAEARELMASHVSAWESMV